MAEYVPVVVSLLAMIAAAVAGGLSYRQRRVKLDAEAALVSSQAFQNMVQTMDRLNRRIDFLETQLDDERAKRQAAEARITELETQVAVLLREKGELERQNHHLRQQLEQRRSDNL